MLNSPQQFHEFVEQCQLLLEDQQRDKWVVSVGISECSVAKGARETWQVLEQEFEQLNLPVILQQVGCGGWCWAEPFVKVKAPGGSEVLYGNINQERATALANAVVNGNHLPHLAIGVDSDEPLESIPPLKEHPYFGRQHRIILQNAGVIDPELISEYVAAGGYQAFVKAITDMTPEEVIGEVQTSNVRGRGGAGFPAGIKWDGGRATPSWPKYVVVNAHEGEPNVYKDRRLIESDPHQLLEGIMIACYAIDAAAGLNYIGGEHAMAARRFRTAVDQAYELGLLGDNVLGTGKNIHVRTRLGSGAYIAGEEMALIESLEGKQAMPRTKPPFPTVIGYLNQPTVLNNAETLCNIPHIVNRGGEWFASIGTEGSKGTKLVTMQGPTKRSGVVEVEMGMNLRDLVYDVYGGMADGKSFGGLQTGGVSAGPLTADMLPNYAVDFDSMRPVGGMLGSGGFVLFDDTVCPVQLALYLTEFSRMESCGKCTPCRLGGPALVEILRRITNGMGREGDLELIEAHSERMINLSLCGLGVAAPAPVQGFLTYYRAEFERHIFEHTCTAGACPIHGTSSIRRNLAAASTVPEAHRMIPLTAIAVGND